VVRVKQDILPSSKRPGHSMNPDYITIHQTGNTSNGANAEMHARFLHNNAPVPSWHETVDDEIAIQHLPYNENGWHAGDGSNGTGNRNSIGIELCINNDGNYRKTVENGAKRAAELIKQGKVNKGYPEALKQHYEWTGKDCPAQIRAGKDGITWQDFVNKVGEYLNMDSRLTDQIIRNEEPMPNGSHIAAIQDALRELGYEGGDSGYYGPKTEEAVRNFQEDANISVDGVWGPETQKAVEKALNQKEQEEKEKSPDLPDVKAKIDVKIDGESQDIQGYLINNTTHIPAIILEDLADIDVTGHGSYITIEIKEEDKEKPSVEKAIRILRQVAGLE